MPINIMYEENEGKEGKREGGREEGEEEGREREMRCFSGFAVTLR